MLGQDVLKRVARARVSTDKFQDILWDIKVFGIYEKLLYLLFLYQY